MVHLCLSAVYNTLIPANVNFGMIPDGYRPPSHIDVPAMMKNQNDVIFFKLELKSNGNIVQNATSTMKDLYVDTWYTV
jgi:hypothetical protein